MDLGAANLDSFSLAGSLGLFLLDFSLLLVLLFSLFKFVEESLSALELTSLDLAFLLDLSFDNVSFCLMFLGPSRLEDLICALDVLDDSLRLKLESDLSLLAEENPLEELVRFDTAVFLCCFSLFVLSLLKSFSLSSMDCFVGVPFGRAVCECCCDCCVYGLDGILLPGASSDELGRDL